MMSGVTFWLSLNILTLIVMGFFSTMEMACVSFNKVKLQYYLSHKNKRAKWLYELLKNPSQLFGTTLIGVNLMMMVGSESGRELYAAMGVNPSLAAITQIFVVITFGELAPLFAARRYPETITMVGIPLLYASSKVMQPFLFFIDFLTKAVYWMFGKNRSDETLSFTRDELQKILEEESHHSHSSAEGEDFNLIVQNIFSLREKKAREVMEQIDSQFVIPANTKIGQIKELLKKRPLPFFLLYHKQKNNIVGIAFPRDLIRYSNSKQARDFSRPPWFITQETPVTKILSQFRENNQTLTVVLNQHGKAVGILTLEAVIEEVFGQCNGDDELAEESKVATKEVVDRTVGGEMKLSDFCDEFKVDLTDLQLKQSETISQLITRELGHHPEVGEIVRLGGLELSVLETTLLGAKKVIVKTKRV